MAATCGDCRTRVLRSVIMNLSSARGTVRESFVESLAMRESDMSLLRRCALVVRCHLALGCEDDSRCDPGLAGVATVAAMSRVLARFASITNDVHHYLGPGFVEIVDQLLDECQLSVVPLTMIALSEFTWNSLVDAGAVRSVVAISVSSCGVVAFWR